MSKRWRKIKKQNTPQNISLPLQEDSNYATFWERGKAQVIDTFMIYLPLLYFLTYVVIGSAQGFRDSNWGPFVAVLIYGLIVALLMALKSQTPGKKAYDLWVRRENNQPITFLFALLRFFLFLISGVTIIGILMPLWRKDKSTLHDLLLKTRVFKKS